MAAVLSGARRSRAQWQSLIERAQRSSLSVTAFCASQGVSTARFYVWRKRLAAETLEQAAPAAGAFLDLGELAGSPPAEGAPGGGWELELDLGAGLVLRLRRR
jgi:hypothetical protein